MPNSYGRAFLGLGGVDQRDVPIKTTSSCQECGEDYQDFMGRYALHHECLALLLVLTKNFQVRSLKPGKPF